MMFYEKLDDELGKGVRLYIDSKIYERRGGSFIYGANKNYTAIVKAYSNPALNEATYQAFLNLIKNIGEGSISRNEFLRKVELSEPFDFGKCRISVNMKEANNELEKEVKERYERKEGFFGKVGAVGTMSGLGTLGVILFFINPVVGGAVTGLGVCLGWIPGWIGGDVIGEKSIRRGVKKEFSPDTIDYMFDKMGDAQELRETYSKGELPLEKLVETKKQMQNYESEVENFGKLLEKTFEFREKDRGIIASFKGSYGDVYSLSARIRGENNVSPVEEPSIYKSLPVFKVYFNILDTVGQRKTVREIFEDNSASKEVQEWLSTSENYSQMVKEEVRDTAARHIRKRK